MATHIQRKQLYGNRERRAIAQPDLTEGGKGGADRGGKTSKSVSSTGGRRNRCDAGDSAAKQFEDGAGTSKAHKKRNIRPCEQLILSRREGPRQAQSRGGG